jgi:hypothetical protein
VRLEVLGLWKEPKDLIGIRIRNLLACSIVPQATTPPRAPYNPVFLLLWLLSTGGLYSFTETGERNCSSNISISQITLQTHNADQFCQLQDARKRGMGFEYITRLN